jgi:tetratricopeptide (TPR) repeat protein
MRTRRFTRTALLTLAVGLCWGVAAAEEPTAFPPAAREQYEQGLDLQKKGQLNEAVRAFEEAIRLGMAAYPRVHLKRANSNLDLKKYDTAIAQYTKFIADFGLEGSCRY